MLFRIDQATELQLRPDLAFVSHARWPRDRPAPREAAWDVVPDLAVEVVSPSNSANEVIDKLHEYFQAGVQRVWVVYPKTSEVYVYEAPQRVRILGPLMNSTAARSSPASGSPWPTCSRSNLRPTDLNTPAPPVWTMGHWNTAHPSANGAHSWRPRRPPDPASRRPFPRLTTCSTKSSTARSWKKTIGAFETEIASILAGFLAPFVRANRLGKVLNEMLFRIDPGTDLQRRPDVAFVSHDRWPRDRPAPREAAWDVVPDLAVEVVNPSSSANEVIDKLHEYFQAGVQQVWLVYPRRSEIYVYEAPTRVRILGRGDELDGEASFPDFASPWRRSSGTSPRPADLHATARLDMHASGRHPGSPGRIPRARGPRAWR